MPLQVVEAVASFGGFSRTHAAQLGTLVHLKSLIYKHSIIVLIFQGTQRKTYNICLMLAAGIEPVKPEQAKRVQPVHSPKANSLILFLSASKTFYSYHNL